MADWFANNSTKSVRFSSPTLAAATDNWTEGVTHGLIGSAAKAFGWGISNWNIPGAAAQFAQSALRVIGAETLVEGVHVVKAWNKMPNGHDFTVKVQDVWTGPHPLAMVTRSDSNLPAEFRGTSFFKNDDGDSVTRLPDGQLVIFRTGCMDVVGTAAANRIELCDKGKNSVASGAGDDIIKTNGNNDWLNASTGNDILYAGAGNDTLKGGPGVDKLYAGTGTDKLYGGTGRDTYYIDGRDTIFDLDPSEGDRVRTTGSERIITGVQTTRTGNLLSVDTATGDRFVFDTDRTYHGNDGWTLKEAQWFADNYVFI